jgi:tetratricopeptide (TPR) repeat protein
MARAAVKAKQQAKAKAQPTKAARKRGRRGHSGGGNPNQDLFFVRLRRRQKWIYAFLAVIFALTFAGVGVGSGNGGGLDQLYSGLFGGGGDSVSKAQKEIKKNPVKGYRDLATAYETKSDNVNAITALQSYLALKKNDANVWSELGGLELTQAQTYLSQYQAVQQNAQLADPSAPFLPSGTLAQAVGTNAAYQNAAQQASSQASSLYQQVTTALSSSVTDYQKVTKIRPRNATAWEELATAATNAGDGKVALGAWKTVLKLDPHSPQRASIEQQIKSIQKQIAATSQSTKPTVSSGNSKPKSGKK